MSVGKVGLAAAGLVGLYLLIARGDGAAAGGFGGGGGADEPGDTVITFPELDLSNIWGDGLEGAKKSVTDPGVDLFTQLKAMGEMPTIGEAGDIMARSEFDISQYRTTTKKLSATTPVKAFTLPFLGATGAPSFGAWMRTHNIYGKKIVQPKKTGGRARYPYDVGKAAAPVYNGVRQYIPRGHL